MNLTRRSSRPLNAAAERSVRAMKIIRDKRLEEFKRIEHLLYGINYEVWFNLFGPCDSDASLESAIRKLISNDCEVSGVAPSSPKDAEIEIMDMVLYEGDTGSGPIELEKKNGTKYQDQV